MFDLGAFSQMLMYNTVSRGLGTMSAYETVKYPQIVRTWLDIPEKEAVAMGYPDDHMVNNLVTTREPLEKVLTIKD